MHVNFKSLELAIERANKAAVRASVDLVSASLAQGDKELGVPEHHIFHASGIKADGEEMHFHTLVKNER